VDPGRYHLLHQHVHGWIVRAPRDTFIPEVATLLDFRVPLPPGTGFCYVLPFTPREALVELVTLRPADAEPLVRDYLRRALDLPEVEVLDREAGVSPMTERPFPWRDGPRVRRTGVAAGRLKPSTGYAVTRILDEAADVVTSLAERGHPFAPPRRARLAGVLDGVLLELWTTHPERVPPAFDALFRRNPPDAVLRFLDERPRPADLLRILVTLPTWPFLAAAVRWSARRCLPRRRASGA
jgi:lycopene beta-cyclase